MVVVSIKAFTYLLFFPIPLSLLIYLLTCCFEHLGLVACGDGGGQHKSILLIYFFGTTKLADLSLDMLFQTPVVEVYLSPILNRI